MPPRIHVPSPLAQAGSREVRISGGRPARPLDLVPVRAGPDVLGLLAVSVDEKTVDTHGRRRALEHGSTVLALELAKERAAAEVERRLRGDLVEEVLAGGLEGDEAERVARQAERLGHRLPQRAWVVCSNRMTTRRSGAGGSRRRDRLDAALSGPSGPAGRSHARAFGFGRVLVPTKSPPTSLRSRSSRRRSSPVRPS
jgi:hypothetical protein